MNKTHRLIAVTTLFSAVLLSSLQAAVEVEVFPRGSTWKYLLGTSEASSPTNAWRAIGFDDASWGSGAAPIGYGENDVATTLPTSGVGNYTSVYARKTFEVLDPANVAQIQLDLWVDDGLVAYINGVEVGRELVPPGELPFNAVADVAGEPHLFPIAISSGLQTLLQSGDNILAVHFFNANTTSSDIYLDASMSYIEPDLVPPTITAVSPDSPTLNQLTQVTVTFSEEVTGVDELDLLVNGQPATSVVSLGNAYTFYFPQPAFGVVQLSFNPAHGIEDLGVPPNPFDHTAPEASWQYDLVDIFAPTVIMRDPAAGATVRSLTQIRLQFSEPVTGVDAADLLVNDTPAAEVSSIVADQYTFTFPEPATGTVAVAWAPGHGIQDLATIPNSFVGDSWQYLLDPTASAATLFITEFMADNEGFLLDDDGEKSDWIEIYNAGDVAADLLGWYLTDNQNDLRKWRFPETNLVAGGYMVVFASGKDRKKPGEPLHTNFGLSRNGEYLALVKPDGETIASEFFRDMADPPDQKPNVSYGLPTSSAPTVLVTDGASAKVLVPTDGNLGLDWIANGFDDSSWTDAQNGVGFEGSPSTFPNLTGAFQTDIGSAMQNVNSSVYVRIPFVMADPAAFDFLNLRMKYDDGLIVYLNGAEMARRNFEIRANSVQDFSGVQGSNSWYYGYYNQTTDTDGTYQASDFIPFAGGAGMGAWNAVSQHWTGSTWDLNTASAAPWTQVTSDGGHPNGSNSGNIHWAVRRYVAEDSGTMVVQFHLSKSNTGGGNGTTGHVFHNGTEVFSRTVAFNETSPTTNQISIPGVAAGDFIDFALDAVGTDGLATDGSDGSYLTADISYAEGLFPDFNVAATSEHPDGQATTFEDVDVSFGLVGLGAGTNILAIHGLNIGPSDDDFLAAVELSGRTAVVLTDQPRYFVTPTPGGPNGVGVDNLGPILSELEHYPASAQDNDDLVISVKVAPSFAPVSNVSLRYRVMFDSESSLTMADNGLGGDAVAGDGIYSATIPAAGLSVPGQMIRWFVTAADTAGRISRLPAYEDPLNSPQYDGTMVFVAQTNDLPLLHLFIQDPNAAATTAGTRCSLFYDGEFYDNLGIDLHGQSSSGFPKKSYDVDFHPGHNFRWNRDEKRVDDINLMTTYPDKAYMRNMLAYDTYRDAGSTYHFVFPVRIHTNGGFSGVWHLMENGEDDWLDRLGLDPKGALYKMYNTFTTLSHTTIGSSPPEANVAEKKSRRWEGNADLVDLFNGFGAGLPQSSYTNYMFDKIDIPATVNYLAARILTGDRDCCHKNYYFYRDSEGTGEWQGMPWDVDLSFGRNWTDPKYYWNNAMFPNNELFIGGNNGFFQKFFNYQPTRQMYLRRIRTLMDELLQTTNTAPHELKYEARIDALADTLRADAALDIAKNGTWFDNDNGTARYDTSHVDYETLDKAVGRLKQYLPDRRHALYDGVASGSAEIPGAQPADAMITFGTIEYNPGTGNQAHEYLELINTNNYYVDISGWKMTNAIEYTFKGGTVIPPGGRLYLSPDVVSFRARPFSPRAGEGRFVQGNYAGQLSARGETVTLLRKDGRVVVSRTYPGNPSPAQQFLRITEIMYHPGPVQPGEPSQLVDDYEYIELKNISSTETLSLNNIHFTNGIAFTFTGSMVTTLGPGETVLVVKNQAAFLARHSGGNIAGVFDGQLDNGGERIRLDDAAGEKILDFSYNDSWYPTTDGLGFSLVIVNENADFRTWDLKESWRPSGQFNGSPDADDPDPVAVAPILINETLTHTDLPEKDTVEFYNTNDLDVNIGGWFLSDDFIDARKYRIPDNTIVPAGGYLLLDEDDFNPIPGVPPSFSFSSKGDEVYLFSGDGTDLTGYFHGFSFDGADNGVSFGRYITSIGEEHFVSQSANTLPGTNALPKVGPVVISEIMYHPPDFADGEDNQDDEYVELHNISEAEVFLYDTTAPTNSWELRDAVRYAFPNTASLLPDGYLLVVSFDPIAQPDKLTAFRSKYAVPTEVAIYGPYDGKLDNSAEKVKLYKPDPPNPLELPFTVPYILVDRVHYRDSDPWPFAADGFGPALVRNNDAEYGDDPINWRAAAPSAGRAASGGTPPVITDQPADTVGVLGQSATLTVAATGSAPLQYQWQFENANLPGANEESLTLPGLKLKDAGTYLVAVYNPAGAVVSSNAQLLVLIPAVILAQPQSQNARLGSNVVFSVSATSTSEITYQWRKNGINLPGETGDTLTLLNVQESDAGDYSVIITDAIATQESAVATLVVLVNPSIVRLQTQYQVVQGRDAILSIETLGSLPMTYRWRKNFGTLKIETLDSHVSFLTLPNVQPADGGSTRYTVVLTNAAFWTPGILSPTVYLTVVVDTDGDGLPDAYESANGLDPNNPNDADGDPDEDGMTTGEEYIAGTDPNDGNSYLRIEQVSFGGGVDIAFMAMSNRTYSVEYKDLLEELAWQKLADVAADAVNRLETVRDPSGSLQRFYRLATPRQE